MKRIALLFIFCLPLLVQSQERSWCIYPSLGADMGGAIPFPFSDIPKGSKGTPKLFPSLGLGYEKVISDKWGIGLEISYHVLSFSANAKVRSQEFFFNNHQDILYFSGNTKTDVELRFLQIPLIAEYYLNPGWTILFGPYYSKIFEGTFNTNGTEGVISDNIQITDSASLPGVAEVKYNFNEYIDSWDAGVLIGFRYNISQKLFFWGNFNIGFKSIFRPDFDQIDYEMYQMRLNIGVAVSLYNPKQKD
jgi:hypothetical protein